MKCKSIFQISNSVLHRLFKQDKQSKHFFLAIRLNGDIFVQISSELEASYNQCLPNHYDYEVAQNYGTIFIVLHKCTH